MKTIKETIRKKIIKKRNYGINKKFSLYILYEP